MHGRKRVPVIPTVEANISDEGTLSRQDLVTMVDETVTVGLDNGKTYIISRHDFGPSQLDTGGGQIGVKFEDEEPLLCSKRAAAAEGQADPFGIAARAGCGGAAPS